MSMARSARASSRPISVARRVSGDTAHILVRAGETELGMITSLGSGEDDTLAGVFTHRPAYADHAEAFRALAEAVATGDAAEIARRRDAMERLGIEVWHTAHEMRIDRPGTLTITGGRARFKPNDAFLMMRTGGLG